MLIRVVIKLTALLLFAAAGWLFVSSRPLTHAPGILVPVPPTQKELPAKSLGQIEGWHLTAVA